jgi:hypothetical protein
MREQKLKRDDDRALEIGVSRRAKPGQKLAGLFLLLSAPR